VVHPRRHGEKFDATTAELIAGLAHPAQSVRLVASRRIARAAPKPSRRSSRCSTTTLPE